MDDETMTAENVRPMVAADLPGVVAFARRLPVHDLLFLRRDIRSEKVVRAWLDQIEQGMIRTLLAVSGENVVGCVALVSDPFTWSPHVVELRLLVSRDARGSGLGRKLAERAFALAVEEGCEKIAVHVTPDQTAAIALFEEMGFSAEAMLLDHVRDATGITYDLAILSLHVARQSRQLSAFGTDTI